MLFDDPELDAYIDARIEYHVTQLSLTGLFPPDMAGDLRGELALEVLKARSRYLPHLASARTFYAHVLLNRVRALLRNRQAERAVLEFRPDVTLPEPAAGLDGSALGVRHANERMPDSTAAMDLRADCAAIVSRLPADLQRIYALHLQGYDRADIMRALHMSASNVSRKLKRLRATLHANGIRPRHGATFAAPRHRVAATRYLP